MQFNTSQVEENQKYLTHWKTSKCSVNKTLQNPIRKPRIHESRNHNRISALENFYFNKKSRTCYEI